MEAQIEVQRLRVLDKQGAHVVEKLNKIVRSERKLRAELGREPSAAEIGIDLDLTAEEVEQIRRSSQVPVSLEKPVGDEEESEFGHFITDESAPLPDEAAETTLRRETLEKIRPSAAWTPKCVKRWKTLPPRSA